MKNNSYNQQKNVLKFAFDVIRKRVQKLLTTDSRKSYSLLLFPTNYKEQKNFKQTPGESFAS